MTLDPNAGRGREVVTYVRVGRGMVKVTKYENEQPKSPSDTTSVKSSHSDSSRSASTPGPSRGWLRRPRAKGPNKRAPSAHRSRSRSSARSLHTIRRPGGYMHSEHDLTTSRDRTPSRRGRPEPQGLIALNSLPVPGSQHPSHGETSYDNNYPRSSPRSKDRADHGLRITPPLSTSPSQIPSNPSPSTLSWTTESEIDPAADSEMWSSISRLEDELVSRFGRGVVPQLTALRQEKTSAPPAATATSKDRTPALPDELVAALHREPPPLRNEKLKQRSFEPITTDPPRRVHRSKSSPTLSFPMPPPTMPSWVTTTPLPMPPVGQGFAPSSTVMRAKFGPPPPFAPPPNFPPPPPPKRRPEDRDMQKELDALVALYDVLEAGHRFGAVKSRSTTGGRRRPGEPNGIRRDTRSDGLKSGGARPFTGPREDVLEEDEGSATPSGSVANVL